MRAEDLVGGWPAKSWEKKPSSFDERHLVDLLQCSHATARFVESRLAQECHAFIARNALDLRSGALVQNHFADVLAQVEQFVDGGTASETRAAAFKATRTLMEGHMAPFFWIQTALHQ